MARVTVTRALRRSVAAITGRSSEVDGSGDMHQPIANNSGNGESRKSRVKRLHRTKVVRVASEIPYWLRSNCGPCPYQVESLEAVLAKRKRKSNASATVQSQYWLQTKISRLRENTVTRKVKYFGPVTQRRTSSNEAGRRLRPHHGKDRKALVRMERQRESDGEYDWLDTWRDDLAREREEIAKVKAAEAAKAEEADKVKRVAKDEIQFLGRFTLKNLFPFPEPNVTFVFHVPD